MPLIPLLPDLDARAIVAYRGDRAIARAEFLRHVLAVAEMLPARGKVLNMCADRYVFAVALFAAIVRENITILPNSAAPEHIAAVAAEHRGLLVLGDRSSLPIADLPFVSIEEYIETAIANSAITNSPIANSTSVNSNSANSESGIDMPRIDFDQIIAEVYTSGSTGTPQPHRKTFGRMRLNILAGAERLWHIAGGPCAVAGTTPIRHMYGLESSVLLPLWGGGTLSAEIPFFPADVASRLQQMPAPRLLVSTPFHLRKLIETDLPLPPVAAVLSATAPLSRELAAAVSRRLSCSVIEIYGSTETGQLATRLPCESDSWETLAGVELKFDGEDAVAHGAVYENPQPINDVVELISPSHFRLVDRKANIINVAGKRNSLSCLNAAIARIPGVTDAVFFVPKREANAEIERLAAFVVAPELNRTAVLTGLKKQIDPVFLPRPLIFVDALPRDGNGKIQAAALQALIAKYSSSADRFEN